MSHKNPLRKDKTCLNCHYVVQDRFCSNCGQENTDTRKTFHHLFIHFFEDLTHYENAFWKTIKNLLTKPGELTKQYLSGKRMSYLAPVRLYIFISFVTFFTISILSSGDDSEVNEKEEIKKEEKALKTAKDSLSKIEKEIVALKENKTIDAKIADSILAKVQKVDVIETKEKMDNEGFNIFTSGYKTVAQLDSVRKVNPEEMGMVKYWFNKKTILIHQKYSNTEIKEKFIEEMKHNIPKTLFFYMPTFAFLLWLFHNKKRWYYFDHGIFTLHYFSFLLLITLLLFLNGYFKHLFNNTFTNVVHNIIAFIGIVWMFYYFFPAHHRFYGGSRAKTIFLGIAFLFINFIFLIFGMILFAAVSFLSIH